MTIADDFLEDRAAFGFVVPIKRGGKSPDQTMSQRQRKTPKWKDHPHSYRNRLTMRAEVQEWADEGLGIGMIAGRLGIVALDIDVPEIFMPMLDGLSGLRTATAKSPGGFHLFFKAAPGIGNQDISCPLFNDPDSPSYCGRHHLASLRVDDEIAVLPPTEDRKWLLPPREAGFAEMPAGLLDLFESFGNIASQRRQAPRTDKMQLPHIVRIQVEGAVLLDFDVRDELKSLITDSDSPLITALVRRMGGEGLKIRCPYHLPDLDPSATFWLGEGGWRFVCHHTTPSTNLFVSQLGSDLLNGYCARIAAGESDPYRHSVSRLDRGKQKARRESWVHLTRIAADVGVVDLSPSRFPALEGFTGAGEQVMQFVDSWGRAYSFTFNKDEFPLARRWLISIVFSMPSTDEKSPAWRIAFGEIDNALHRALQEKLLEKVAVGKVGLGGTATRYRLLGKGGGDKT